MAMEGGCFVMTATQILTAKNVKRANVEGYFYAQVPGGGCVQIAIVPYVGVNVCCVGRCIIQIS